MCDSGDATLRYRLSRFAIWTCGACGQIFLWPQPTEDEIRGLFSQLYTTGEGSVPELRSYYGFCYQDDSTNPLVQLYERWLARTVSQLDTSTYSKR